MRTIARISEARNQLHQIEVAVEKCEFYLGKLSESARKATESRDGALTLSADWDQRVSEAEDALETARQTAHDAISRTDELTLRRNAAARHARRNARPRFADDVQARLAAHAARLAGVAG